MTAPSAGASRAVALVEVARPTEGQRRGLARPTVGRSVRVVTGSGLSLRYGYWLRKLWWPKGIRWRQR
jgi:hypothetical protein